jgi:hypothetical protein
MISFVDLECEKYLNDFIAAAGVTCGALQFGQFVSLHTYQRICVGKRLALPYLFYISGYLLVSPH